MMLAAVAVLLIAPATALAQQTVEIGGSQAVLLRPKAPSASVILMPGGISQGNPCSSRAYHGFNGLDSRVVSLAAGFH
jgi:hypothetical protein